MLPKYKQETNIKTRSMDFLIMNIGLIIVAFASVVFKKPNHFAAGGINGLAIVIQYYFPVVSMGIIMLVLNILLLVIGFFIVDKSFIIKSIYGSIALSVFTWLIEISIPFNLPLTNQKFLELFYSVILAGIGSTLAFYKGASTGGTDILAMIIRKFFKVKLSVALLFVDISIALASGFVYGVEAMLYSIFGVIIKVFVMDGFLENIQISKIFTIIASDEDSHKIQKFIVDKLGRGATVTEAKGAFTEDEKIITTTVLERGQSIYLQNFIREETPKAFVTITSSSQIIGRGFTARL